ncbi:hypothetical protein ACFVAE_10400 [Microbacterium sp. NPDC057659]|uniref:hypothetical protein n=1 Tax=Microbacterium sp. NPDC057659 TaxID=3346198 RepID=UPI003672CA7B
MAEVPSTRKVQITVPVADTSVIEWLDLQYSASDSFRRLIREAIAREGYVDVANRPVRPPAEPVHVAEEFAADVEAPAAVPKAVTTAPTTETKAAEAKAPKPEAKTASVKAESPGAPPAKVAKTSAPKAEAASATIDDLLGL